jgi:cytochrome c556
VAGDAKKGFSMKLSTFLRVRSGGIAGRAGAWLAAGGAALLAAMLVETLAAQPPAGATPQPTLPIKELMETTITDASNAIWNAYDPPSSEDQWKVLEEAALKLIAATKVNAVGGTGPMDNEWVKQPAWQPFNGAMLAAGEAALAAVRAKDHTALLAASDELYPPCEGCHLQFNPGVVNAN